MDIKYIFIEGLFGQFNHKITLADNVTIIIGDNGVGKTVTLRLIESIFSNRLAYLFDVEFSKITISFGKEIWQIATKKTYNKESADYPKDDKSLIISSNLNGEHEVLSKDTIIAIPSYILKMSDNEWYDKRRGIVFTERELIDRLGVQSLSDITKNLPEWYTKRVQKNRVRLIDTQRIYHQEVNGRYPELGRMVDKFSNDIVNIVGEYRKKADKVENELDKTYPIRLVQRLSSNEAESLKAVQEKLKDLIDIQSELQQVGLVDYKQDSVMKAIGNDINQPIIKALSLYAEDRVKKLQPYKAIMPSLKLFLEIINARFQYKKCRLDPSKGFIVYHDKKEIPLSRLSSGEQNEFVMFYDLLFNCGETDLILIDEPELSLHLKWQQMIMGDLLSICEQNNLSVLMATHSPDLIGNHWSMVQKLK